MSSAVYSAMIELQAINYMFSKNSVQMAILNGLTPEHFTTYREHYKFILDFYDKYNQLPSKETFQGKFADNFEWLNITDPEDYIISKLNEAKLFRDLVVDYKALGELIKSEQTDKAVEKMATISQQFMKSKQTNCIDLIDDAKLRFDGYKDRVNNPDRSYVTTGLKELDEILGGWDLLNESAVIFARPGVGKSWWLIYFAMAAAKAGLRVGFYSGEMELDLVGYRFDTFLGNIANGSLTHGNDNVMDKYETYLNSLNKVVKGHIFCITPDMVDGSMTVSKLRAFVEKYDIDMLCVDQLSLLDDEKGARTLREQYVNISKSLRNLQRMKKIPILAAAQANRGEKDEELSTRNIAESDRIGQDATTIIAVERKNDNVILEVVKARNARTGDKLMYNWNVNMGTLHYIPSEKDALNGRDSEVLLNEYDDFRGSDSVF